MLYFAKIDENNIVTKIIVVSEEQGQTWCDEHLAGTWLQIRKTEDDIAGIGYVYDPVSKIFISPLEE